MQCAPCGESWLTMVRVGCQVRASSLMEGAFIIPALDAHSHVLSIRCRRNGFGKLVFKVAFLKADSRLLLLHLRLSVPGISPEVLQRVLSQASTANV